MNEPALHPRLERDCHRVGRLPVCHVLLQRNATIPWWILVPAVSERELFQIAQPSRRAIEAECDALASFVLAQPGIEKLNIAAIGNLVPQLHIHVIGRHPGDACWPQPVWGHLQSACEYSPDELVRLTDGLEAALHAASVGRFDRAQ
jgi:diadenosine tetraphosphate (Ap4A) HIT family hydrolase